MKTAKKFHTFNQIINNIQNKMKITFMDKIDDIENDPI